MDRCFAAKNDSEDVRRGMADLWVVITVIGFFVISAGFVWGCDRIIGPDDAGERDSASSQGSRDESVVGVDR